MRTTYLKKKNSPYTYDHSRKLGSLIPLEVEKKKNTERDISQLVINEIREARGEPSWTGKDVKMLRAAALCEVVHYYRALRISLKECSKEAVLKSFAIDRDEITLEIMKGSSVREAFMSCCGVLDLEELLSSHCERHQELKRSR